MFSRFTAFFQAARVILRKDIRIWLRQPANMAATIIPPVAFLLVGALGAAALGRSPVALVMLDRGPKGQQMAQIFHSADVFRLTDVNPQQAQALLNNIDVVAIITIPADFTRRVDAHQNAPIDVTVNNLNLDFTNDIRRSVPDAITQFYHAQGSSSPVQVTMREHDLRKQDVEFFEYSVLPTIVLLLTISGLINGGLSTAREWESRTVKELLLAPASRGAIIAGKVLAGFAIPLTYGRHALEMAIFYSSSEQFGLDMAVLAISALVAVGLGILAMRRGIAG